MTAAAKIATFTPAVPAGPVQPEVDNVLRLALNGSGRRAPEDRENAKRPDFAASMQLLERAAATVEALRERCSKLEEELISRTELFRAELSNAAQQAREWERCAKAVKAQLADAQNLAMERQLRAETAAYRAEHAETRAAQAEQQSSEALSQAQRYHDLIVAAFGGQIDLPAQDRPAA